jgi:hypothetical protein
LDRRAAERQLQTRLIESKVGCNRRARSTPALGRIESRKVMKIALSLVAIFLFIVTSRAQSRTISKDEYEKVFEFGVSKTNEAYPVIFKVTTVFIENGKTVRTVTDLNENESPLHHRINCRGPHDE